MSYAKQFQTLVEAYETIAIFRHVNPDGDALGSQLGLAKWLRLNYPNKTIITLGDNDHHYSIYNRMDEVEELGKFLAIVVDTANRPRADDQRFELGDKIIKIDHHPEVDPYGDLQIVDVDRGSACEIVTDLLRELDGQWNADIANTLLSGILTDTIRFSIEKTSEKTLSSAAFLMSQGANITALNEALFVQPQEVFMLKATMMPHVTLKDNLAYIFLTQDDLKAMGTTARDVKAHVNIMSGVEEFKIWTVFVEGEDGSFEGSIRSRNHTINDIAEKHGGGGHRLASGISNLDRETAETMIQELRQRSTEVLN